MMRTRRGWTEMLSPCVLRNGWRNEVPDREWVDKMQKFLFPLLAHWNPAWPPYKSSFPDNIKNHFMLSSDLAFKSSCNLTDPLFLLTQFSSLFALLLPYLLGHHLPLLDSSIIETSFPRFTQPWFLPTLLKKLQTVSGCSIYTCLLSMVVTCHILKIAYFVQFLQIKISHS